MSFSGFLLKDTYLKSVIMGSRSGLFMTDNLGGTKYLYVTQLYELQC